MIIGSLLLIPFLLYTLFWTGYDFVLALFSVFYRNPNFKPTKGHKKFIIVIPAFREGTILLSTVRNAMEVDYPADCFKVVVLAQDIKETVQNELEKLGAELVVSGALGSKLNAMKNWLKKMGESSGCLFMLDADNVIQPQALHIANKALDSCDLIQFERIKTPPSTALGLLDRWNTTIGLAISNDSRSVLGLNTFILGSGFAIKLKEYKAFVDQASNTIAEDKALDLYLASQKKSVLFTKECGVHDATMENQDAFNDQRARWVGGKIEARKQSRELLKKDWFSLEYWDKAIHYTAPQRSILMTLVLGTAGFNLILSPLWYPKIIGFLPFILSMITILFTTPLNYYDKKLIYAFFAVPASVWGIVKARVKAKTTSQKDFKVTPK